MPSINENPPDDNSTSTNGDPISFDLNELAEQSQQKENDIIVNSDVEEGDDASLSQIEKAYTHLSEADEHIKQVLLSRRKENSTIKARRDLLFSFVFGTKGAHLKSFFHPEMESNTALLQLHEDLMKTCVRKHETRKKFIGESLFTIWMLLQESDRLKEEDLTLRATRRETESTQIKNFRAFMVPISNRHNFDCVNATSKKQRSVKTQSKVGEFIQDEFARNNPDWFKKILSAPCPLCNHNSLVAHEKDEDILNEITLLKENWKKENADFHRLPPTEQAKRRKPKMPTYPKQHLICMCLVNRCRDFTTGKGCINCQSTTRSGADVSYNPITGHSNCSMCKCDCTAYFKRIEWSKIKAQVEVDKESKAIATREKMMQRAAGELINFE